MASNNSMIKLLINYINKEEKIDFSETITPSKENAVLIDIHVQSASQVERHSKFQLDN